MLTISKFAVFLGEKTLVAPITYTFADGTTTLITGKNGSGKTSLLLSLFGHYQYRTSGTIDIDGKEIQHCTPTDRARNGMFLSFQNIPEIPGISLLEYLRTIYMGYFSRKFPDKKPPSMLVFRKFVVQMLEDLLLDESFLDRDLFVGFSGGEKRRIELLQATMLDAKYIFFDEVDAGLDVQALEIFHKKIIEWQQQGKTIIIVSHNVGFVQTIAFDTIVTMDHGRLITQA